MDFLIGSYDCKLDAKGRLPVPSALRKQLGENTTNGFVIKRSVFQNCLEIYSKSEWDVLMKRINGLNKFVKKNNDFVRRFMAGVKFVEMDANGRLQLAKDLLGFAGLEKEVVLTASGNFLEVWDKKAYESEIEMSEDDFAQLAEEVMGNMDSDE